MKSSSLLCVSVAAPVAATALQAQGFDIDVGAASGIAVNDPADDRIAIRSPRPRPQTVHFYACSTNRGLS